MGGCASSISGVARATDTSYDTDEDTAPFQRVGDTEETRRSALETPLTKVGHAIGTPAYMAPEQRLGVTDERTDQFSLCMTIYEALYGNRPSEHEIRDGVQVARSDAKAPRWLRSLIERGLRHDPADRYPSIRALLADLDRSPPRRWSLFGLSAAVVAAATAGTIYIAQSSGEPEEMWARSTERLDGLWTAESQEQVRATFEDVAPESGQIVWQSVKRGLDRYIDAWVTMDRESCEATNVHGVQSPQLLDARTLCLNDRREEVRALVAIFAGADDGTVDRAIDAVSNLSSLDSCADVGVLSSRTEPPGDPATRERVEELSAALAEAKALVIAGEHKRAGPNIDALVPAAKELAYRPLEAEVLLLQGRFLDQGGDANRAIDVLHEAAQAAEAARDPVLKVHVWLHIALVIGDRLGEAKRAMRWVEYAAATLDGLGKHDDLRARLLERRGLLSNKLGEFDEARQLYEDSLAIVEQQSGPDSYRAGELHLQLGLTFMALGDHDRALHHARRDLEITEAQRGAVHPATALSLNNLSLPLTALGKTDEAKIALARCIRIWTDVFGADYPRLAMPLHNLGDIAMDEQQFTVALENYRGSLDVLMKTRGSDHPDLVYPLSGLGDALAALGHHDEARENLQRAIAVFAAVNGDAHSQLIGPLVGLAEIELTAGNVETARSYINRAHELMEPKRGNPYTRARLRFVLAQLRWSNVAQRADARALATQALDDLQGAGARTRTTREAVEAWLASR